MRVTWNPPPNQTIKIRSYWLSWGKGVPDSFMQQLDDKQRSYIINNLGEHFTIINLISVM